jgi:hypothetical protein
MRLILIITRYECESFVFVMKLRHVNRDGQRNAARLHSAYGRGAGGDAEALRRRLHAIQAEIARLVDAIATVGISDALAGRLKAAESERDDLERRLAAGGVQTPTQVSLADINARWRRKLLQVEQALQEHADRGQTRQLLADVFGPMVLGRDTDGSTYVEFEEPAERLLLAAVGESTGLVAGARNGHWCPGSGFRGDPKSPDPFSSVPGERAS